MALTNPYCSLEDLQRETGNSDTELVSWFETCINNASRWIEEHCHRDFLLHSHGSTPYTVKDSEMVGDSIFLPYPIITLTSITSGDIVVDANFYTYETGGRTIRMKDGSYWDGSMAARGLGAQGLSYGVLVESGRYGLAIPITILGLFGYVEVPAAVRIACARIAAAWSNEKRRERLNQAGQRVSILDVNIPDDALTMLKRYRRLVN